MTPLLYCVYAQQDDRYRQKLAKHVKNMERQGIIRFFSEPMILAGANRGHEIEARFNEAQIFVVLLSVDLFSDHAELADRVLQRFRCGEARVLPVLVREVALQGTGWEALELLSVTKAPAERIDDDDGFWASLADLIRTEAKGLQPSSRSSVSARRRPKISCGNLPTPAEPEIFVGRSSYLQFLDKAWVNKELTIVQFVADGGVGKSTLVWHWQERLKSKGYPDVSTAIDWSFYSQGQRDYETDSRKFFELASDHFSEFGLELNPEQRKNAEVLGRAIAEVFIRVGGIMILDGVEPLQYPPELSGGRIKDQGLASLVRHLLTQPFEGDDYPKRLLIITTRWEIPSIAGRGTCKINLETLSDADGALFLERFRLPHDPQRTLFLASSNSPERLQREYRATVRECHGHALTLVLLASYLLRHHKGDLAMRKDLSAAIDATSEADPYRHARRIMRSYDQMFLVSTSALARACRQVLCLLGLFDRPAPVTLLEVVLQGEPIGWLTQDLSTDRFTEAVEELRKLRLLIDESSVRQDVVDTHPLIREHFSEVLAEYPEQAHEAHRRLYEHLRHTAMDLPDTIEEMEPLFEAVVHGCKAGFHREVLHQVYLRRIMRHEIYYAAEKLGALAALISILSHFFARGGWSRLALPDGSPDQQLSKVDQVIVLLHAGTYLCATKGYSALEVEQTSSAALALCDEVDDPALKFRAIVGIIRFCVMRGDVIKGYRLAHELRAIADSKSLPVDMCVMALRVLATVQFFRGAFAEARDYATRGVETSSQDDRDIIDPAATRARAIRLVGDPITNCLTYLALSQWHLGEWEQAQKTIADAVRRAERLGHAHTLTSALCFQSVLHQYRCDTVRCGQAAQSLFEVACEAGILFFVEAAKVLLGWSLGASGHLDEGIAQMLHSLRDYKRTGAELFIPYWHTLLAELYLRAGRLEEAQERIELGLRMSRERKLLVWVPELHRLRGKVLHELTPARAESERAFRQALESARELGSHSLALRSALSLHRLMQATEGEATAREEVRRVCASFSQDLVTPDLQEARELLTG